MKPVCGAAWRMPGFGWGLWFRIFGYGIAMSNLRPVFSKRVGLVSYVRVFGVSIEWLKPPLAIRE